MAKNDVRSEIIDRLEAYAKEHDLKFIWSIEKKVDGCMIVQFKKGNDGFTYRINHQEIELANLSAKVVTDTLIKMIKAKL